jgi:hypothetical protein
MDINVEEGFMWLTKVVLVQGSLFASIWFNDCYVYFCMTFYKPMER